MLSTFLSSGKSLHLSNDKTRLHLKRYYDEAGSLVVVVNSLFRIRNLEELLALVKVRGLDKGTVIIELNMSCGERYRYRATFK